MKEISKVCDGIMKISTLGMRVLSDNQINNKPTKSGNNGIPKGSQPFGGEVYEGRQSLP